MNTLKCRELIKVLSKSEIDRFPDWLKTFAQKANSDQLVQTFSVLQSETNKENIWESVFPGEPMYDDARMRKLLHELSERIGDYLATISLLKEPRQKDLLLVRTLRKKKAYNLQKKAITLAKNRLKKTSVDPEYYRYLYQLEWELQESLMLAPASKKPVNRLAEINDYFDKSFILEKLYISAINNSYNKAYKLGQNSLFLDRVEEEINQQSPPIDRIYHLFSLLTNGKYEHLEELRSLMKKQKSQLQGGFIHDILSMILNVQIGHSYQQGGNKAVLQEMFDDYIFGIKERILMPEKTLSPSHYKNFIECCLRLQKFDEAAAYIKSLKRYLPKSEREDLYRFNLGNYYFAKGAFSKSIHWLSKGAFNNEYHDIHARSRILEAHYETETDSDWLVPQIHKLKRQIAKNKHLKKRNKESYINRLKLFAKLCKLKPSHNINRFIDEVESTKPIDNKAWLLAKAAKLQSPDTLPGD